MIKSKFISLLIFLFFSFSAYPVKGEVLEVDNNFDGENGSMAPHIR